MNELLKKIYNEILVYEKDIIATNKVVDNTVYELIKSYHQNLTAKEYDELKQLIFSAVSIAEQAGFENGVRFSIKIMHSLF